MRLLIVLVWYSKLSYQIHPCWPFLRSYSMLRTQRYLLNDISTLEWLLLVWCMLSFPLSFVCLVWDRFLLNNPIWAWTQVFPASASQSAETPALSAIAVFGYCTHKMAFWSEEGILCFNWVIQSKGTETWNSQFSLLEDSFCFVLFFHIRIVLQKQLSKFSCWVTMLKMQIYKIHFQRWHVGSLVLTWQVNPLKSFKKSVF